MKLVWGLLFLFISTFFLHAENLSNLLEVYQKESELSKITKKDSAGFLDIFTRDELEKMQAHNLLDILKIIPGIYLQKGPNGTIQISKPTIAKMSFSMIRLYINDHDMSSSTFNSAFLIWGDMPIEYIDHIEVYRATSSIEFGNETSTLVIKIYTKQSRREHGGKVRTMLGNNGSYDLNFYYAQQLENSLSYFIYGNIDNYDKKKYTNYYKNGAYTLDNDKDAYNIYANVSYKKWLIELGNYHKKNQSFIGRGMHQTPIGGELNAKQFYTHITGNFSHDIKLQLSYDNIDYDRTYIDPNGIEGANLPILDYQLLRFKDEIYSIVLEKTFNLSNNKIFIGGFYKCKKFHEYGNFKQQATTNITTVDFGNTLNLYSLYLEDTYKFNDNTTLVASVKGDFYRYKKAVKNQDKMVFRIGGVKKIDNFMFKLFYTGTYMPLAFFQVYSPNNIQLKANPNLEPVDIQLYSASVTYKTSKHLLNFTMAQKYTKNPIAYNPKTSGGFYNKEQKNRFTRFKIMYDYNMDLNNKINLSIFTAKQSSGKEDSPKYGVNLRLFNKYGKFDFYNELLYKSSFTYSDLYMSSSFEFTSAIKYNYSKDLKVGLRGDNIFNSGYEQAYKGIYYSIPVTEQKVWLNLEYLF